MYRIGEFSKLCGLSIKTLRYYAEKGVLVPKAVDNFTGYRYYSEQELELCRKVVMLKSLGFTLADIRDFMKAETKECAQAVAQRVRGRHMDEIRRLEEQIEGISSLMD